MYDIGTENNRARFGKGNNRRKINTTMVELADIHPLVQHPRRRLPDESRARREKKNRQTDTRNERDGEKEVLSRGVLYGLGMGHSEYAQ